MTLKKNAGDFVLFDTNHHNSFYYISYDCKKNNCSRLLFDMINPQNSL